MTDVTQTPRFRDYVAPGAGSFDRARNLIQTGLQQIDIVLSAASPAGGYILPIAGDLLYVDADPVASSGVATAQFNLQQDAGAGRVYLQAGLAVNTPFKQVRLDWAAQPGLSLRLLYSTGDRVVPAPASNPARVQEQGIAYGASYKSSGAMVANTPDNIWSAASNVNGAVLWAANGMSINGGGFCALCVICKATAPAGVTDGDVINSTNAVGAIGAQFVVLTTLTRATRVSPGKRGDWIVNVNDTGAMRATLYTLL